LTRKLAGYIIAMSKTYSLLDREALLNSAGADFAYWTVIVVMVSLGLSLICGSTIARLWPGWFELRVRFFVKVFRMTNWKRGGRA